VPKRVADPPKDNKPSAKPLVVIPMDQLQDLDAAEGEDEEEDLPDLSLDYFQKLENTVATFAHGPITIDDLPDLAEQSIIINNLFVYCLVFIIIYLFFFSFSSFEECS